LCIHTKLDSGIGMSLVCCKTEISKENKDRW
jgi:hypothetical protein